jgi:hypothetical protein
MSRPVPLVCAAILLAAVAVAGCRSVDLRTAVEVTDISSGYYDAGITETGLNKLVPSITFSLRNAADTTLSSVDVVALFWQEGKDAEMDELVVTAISGSGIAPGATSDPIVLRANVGYTIEQPRAELFTHRLFLDVIAKLFAKRGGRIVPIGEFKIDRRLLLSAPGNPASR